MYWLAQPRVTVLVCSALLLSAVVGCTINIIPAESVLAGTWQLTGDTVSPDVGDFLITFDASGQITKLTYVYKSATTVTVNAGDLLRSSSKVNGSDVSISASWSIGNTLFFEGVLNTAQTEIDGSTSYRLLVTPAITVDIPTGPAKLVKR